MYVFKLETWYGRGVIYLRYPGPGEKGFTYTGDINEAKVFPDSQSALNYLQNKAVNFGFEPGLQLVRVEETKTIQAVETL